MGGEGDRTGARSVAVVLFTDLVGSTELRSRLGEAAAEELRRWHDRLLAEAVEAHGGRVVKGLGDGIMARFAAASDAVAAGVAIQQGIDRLNRSAKAPAPLGVRVGISAGDVTEEDDDVHGTPVIEASRLCAAAEGKVILVADVVRVLAGKRHHYASVGALELKGLPDPVPTARVEWEPAPVSTIPVPALLTDVGRIFVGREAEVERLSQLWKEAAAGERRFVLLAGEPGVGKTRLAAELAGRVHDEGAVVLAGRCDEDLGVPYQPFVEALRHFLEYTPPEHVGERLGRYGGELARLVPELTESVPDLPPPLESDPETERYRLFDAVAAWLGASAVEEPFLLVLDDLQWAAKPTLLLLRHVVRSSDRQRVLVLGTYRDTELADDHPLVEVVADLHRQGTVERMSLTGLDSSGVAAFMEQAAEYTLDDEDLLLARAVHEETEGNPFFVREVFRHLLETGALERRDGRRGTRLTVEEIGIPESVREVVGRRLSRLPEEANQALRTAAVVGTEFDVSVVQAVAGLDEEALLCSLEAAAHARLIIEAPSARYRFAHALVRDTLYGELSGPRRVTLHRKVAEAIEALHATRLDDFLPALAHHWARASAPAADTSKAVDYSTAAGDRALAQLANDEAAGWYRQALELLDASGPPVDDAQRCELLVALGEAQRRAGDPDHRETLLAAARLAQDLGDAGRLARAALANHRGLIASRLGNVDAERVEQLEAALDAVGRHDTPTRARLLAALAEELIYGSDRGRLVRLSDEALAIARRSDDRATLAQVLLERFTAIWAPNTLAERLSDTAELLALAAQLADPVTEVQAWFLRFRAAMEAGDVVEADRCLEEAERLTVELGQPTLSWQVSLQRTTRVLMAGDLEEADRLVLANYELGQAAGQPDAHAYLVLQQFAVRFEQGRLDEIEQALAETVRLVPGLPGMRALIGLLDCELDRPGEARAHFEEMAVDGFAGVPFNQVWPSSIAWNALVCTRLRDRARAEVLSELLTPYADQVAFTSIGVFGSLSHHLGLLATILGRFDEAEARFAAAARTHERIGAPTWLARTRLEWARALLSRRRPGDDSRARELLGQARTTARELGLANVERRAVEVLGHIPDHLA